MGSVIYASVAHERLDALTRERHHVVFWLLLECDVRGATGVIESGGRCTPRSSSHTPKIKNTTTREDDALEIPRGKGQPHAQRTAAAANADPKHAKTTKLTPISGDVAAWRRSREISAMLHGRCRHWVSKCLYCACAFEVEVEVMRRMLVHSVSPQYLQRTMHFKRPGLSCVSVGVTDYFFKFVYFEHFFSFFFDVLIFFCFFFLFFFFFFDFFDFVFDVFNFLMF